MSASVQPDTHASLPWLVDSGADDHLTPDQGSFISYSPDETRDVVIGKGDALKLLGYEQ